MRSFHPLVWDDVKATSPHPANAYYRMSIGLEYWDGTPQRVEKVQMAYDGQIAGRQVPSYPAAVATWIRSLRR